MSDEANLLILKEQYVSGVVDNYVLPVICPKCAAHIQRPIAWFKENNEVTCPCGTTIYLVVRTQRMVP
jgi:hypothetical protein